MALEGLDLVLELVLIVHKLGDYVLEVVDLPLEGGDLVLSQLKGDTAIIFEVGKLFATIVLLVAHLLEGVLRLDVLLIQGVEILNLLLKLGKGCLGCVDLQILVIQL